jgi:hypothetical protein
MPTLIWIRDGDPAVPPPPARPAPTLRLIGPGRRPGDRSRNSAVRQLPGPAPAVVARHWAEAIVEALSGRRPCAQMADRCAPAVLAVLGRQSPACRAAGGARLASLRVQSARLGRLEVCLRLRQDGRSRAAALALAWRDGHWRAEALVIG